MPSAPCGAEPADVSSGEKTQYMQTPPAPELCHSAEGADFII